MKKMYGIVVILVTMFMVLSVFGTASAEKPAEPIVIKVGVVTPLSGPAGPWGQVGIPPIDAWVELFNKAGGFKVAGKTYHFQMVYIDDLGTPEGGAAAAKKLIYEQNVRFIAGHWSWNFPSVSAVTNQAKVIFLTRTGNEAVPGGVYDPQKQPYTVFANPSHEEFLADIFALADTFPKYKRIGINDSTQGKGIGWDYVDKELDKAKIRYHHEWFVPGTQDFTPYITRFAEAGCDIVYGAGDVLAAMLIAKQRWEMGYKDWKTGTSGGILDPNMFIGVSGYDASQGFMGQYFAIWDFKKTKVNPKYIKRVREAMKITSKKLGKPYTYTAWIGWMPHHLEILSMAMERAGTVDDPDAIMKAIRGGTFDTTIGKFTMSGAKTYGSPIVFGTPGAMSKIKGDKEVYLGEHPLKSFP
jgi:branched-chain amino acid transport system substrate-binding protein